MSDNIFRYAYEIYAESMFLYVVLGSLALSGFSVIIFTLPYTILDLFNPKCAMRYRTKQESVDLTAAVCKSLKFFGMNFGIQVFFGILSWPVLRHVSFHIGGLPPWWMILLQIVFFLFIDDFLFYWYHRLLHWPWFYRTIHSVHHRMHSPIALSVADFHPIEFLLISLSFLIGPILLGAHVYVLYIWIVLRQWIAVEGHCGYDFPFQLLKLFPFHDGSAFHYRHHRESKTNYGLFCNYLDRLFGTYSAKDSR